MNCIFSALNVCPVNQFKVKLRSCVNSWNRPFIVSAPLSSPFPFSVFLIWEVIYQNAFPVRGGFGLYCDADALYRACWKLLQCFACPVAGMWHGSSRAGFCYLERVCCILSPISTTLLGWGLRSDFLQCWLLLRVFCSHRNKALALLHFKAPCIHPCVFQS